MLVQVLVVEELGPVEFKAEHDKTFAEFAGPFPEEAREEHVRISEEKLNKSFAEVELVELAEQFAEVGLPVWPLDP